MPTRIPLSIPLIIFTSNVGIGSELIWSDLKRLSKEPKFIIVISMIFHLRGLSNASG